MSSIIVTGGLVAFEDGVKSAEEFAPAKKARAEIRFDVGQGADEQRAVDEAANLAVAQVRRLLGQAPAKPQEAVPAEAGKPTRKPRAAVQAQPETPNEKTKADLADELGIENVSTVHKGNPPALVNKPAEPEPEVDDLGDLLGEDAPPPVTDAELVAAAQAKNKAMKEKLGADWSPTRIRDLTTKYAGPNKQFRDVPADKRRAFLADLEAIS